MIYKSGYDKELLRELKFQSSFLFLKLRFKIYVFFVFFLMAKD